MSDSDTGMCTVVGTEVCERSDIGGSVQCFLCSLDTARTDVAGIVDLVESSGHRGSELTRCIDYTVNGVGVSCGTDSVHNDGTYGNLTFVMFSDVLSLDE